MATHEREKERHSINIVQCQKRCVTRLLNHGNLCIHCKWIDWERGRWGFNCVTHF